MATTTPNFGWPVPTSTDLVKDGATAIEALGDSIDASLLDLKGGTSGQVVAKNSNTDMDFIWVTDAAGDISGVTAGTGITGGGTSGTVTVTNSMATAIDAKGDLVAGTAADTFARLAVGADGTVLTADSAEATGLKWTANFPTDISCRVYAGTATNLSTTFASIAFNTENFDTDTMHDNSTNNSRITIKTAGKYQVGGQVNTAANQALGLRLFVNGGSVIGRIFQGNSASTEGANINTIYDFALNDYIELQAALGASTGTTTTDQQTNFWAYKI